MMRSEYMGHPNMTTLSSIHEIEGLYAETKDEDCETDTIKIMLSNKHFLDKMLCEAAKLNSDGCNFYIPRYGNETEVDIMSSVDIESWQNTLKNISDIDQMKKSIGDTFMEKEYILPFEGTDCQDGSVIIDLPNLGELKKDLSKRTSTTYVIKRIKEDLPIEIPLDDFCDEIYDDMHTYEDDIEKMKYEDVLIRELHIGDVEYYRLSCKVRQVITGCDILVEEKNLEHITQRILSICIAWKNDLVTALATKVLSVLFPSRLNGSFLVLPEDIENVTRCHIGCRQWGSNYWGLGLALERGIKLNVYWQDANDLNNSSDISNPSNYVTSFECTINQGFALACSKDEDSSTFLFSSEYDECNELSLETDANQGYLRLKMFPSENEQTSQIPKKDALTHLSESFKRLPLKEVVQDLVHDKVQDEQKLVHTFQTVVAWGNNICNHLGIELNDDGTKKEVSPHPESISRNYFLGIETVKMIDCSSCHTLLLSNLGNVYSCGEGSDGQLGHDTLDSSCTFRLIEWFIKRDGTQNRIEVIQISAGGDESISHSAAIDVEGYLYTWGKAIVCGHIEKLDSKVNSRIQQSSITLPKRVEVLKDHGVLQVSCGCGFTLARVTGRRQEASMQDNDVQVYSWGITTRGRLGIGNLEQKFQRIPKYQMIPTVISALIGEHITEVKAGTMHAIAVNNKGEVFCWGSNSKGECSVVDIDDSLLANIEKQRFHDRYDDVKQTTYPSLWDDVWTPRKLEFFGARKVCTAQSVSAGGHQSAVIDTSGRVYTWGGGGQGYCLGHGHTTINRLPTYSSYDKKNREMLVISGCASVPHWAIPRLVESLVPDNIIKVSLGNYHGAALSSTGSVHLWGDPSAISIKSNTDDPYSNIQYSNEIINVKESIPIVPNVKYLSKLTGANVVDISCGNGSTFCILTGYRILTALNKLYGDCHVYSVRSDEYYAEDDSINGHEIGGIDCVVIVGGKRMYCHKLVLAQRSSVLKAIITDALPQDMSSIIEIVLPDIPYTVMSDIIKFIYTGTLTKTDLRNYFDIKCLYDTAGKLNIPSLVHFCENILKYYHDSNTELPNDSFVSQEHNDTVVIDIGNALNDPKFADVKILTDDEIDIMAHACILKSTSTYFRSIINVNQKRSPILEIKLPGSYSSIIRMLLYLYTGIVSEISSEQDLVGDLKNAHKYELWDMKSQCESALSVTISNAPDILLLSQQVESKRLQTEALITIAHNLKSYYNCKDSKEKLLFILSQCSYTVRDELFERIKEVKGPESIIPEMHRRFAQSCIDKGRHRQSRMMEKLEAELIGNFSVKRIKMSTILWGVLIGIGYLFLLNFANVQKLIPIINIVALSVGFMQLYNSLK